MKISSRDIVNLTKTDYREIYDLLEFENYPYLRSLKNVQMDIHFSYDALDRLTAHVRIIGSMICPDALTLEDTEVPLQIEDDTLLTYDEESENMVEEDEMSYSIDEGLDTEDFLLTFVLPEVPIKVVNEGKKEYPKGDGWRVMTEAEFEESRRQKRDPRWDKLRDLEIDKEE